jgi:hypothetical protein
MSACKVRLRAMNPANAMSQINALAARECDGGAFRGRRGHLQYREFD